MEGTNKTLCKQARTQEKGAVSPQETEPGLPVSVQESVVEVWVDSGLLRGQDTEYNSAVINPFQGDLHYCHYTYHSLATGQTTGREYSPSTAQQQKIGLKIY